jgi:Oxidoreductase molybdopterin binding domain/Phage integrase family
MAGVKSGSLLAQFQGLETGQGPKGLGSNLFLKSLDLGNPVVDECVVAYLMNGEPLPMLNGFPVRLVVPGYFATYWTKCLTWIRVLDAPDENFWMKTGYRVPDTPRGNTTPEDVKAGKVITVPIERFPVRSFLISPVVRVGLKPVLRKLGISSTDTGLHAFRHGLATELAEASVPLTVLQSQLRHADVRTTLRVYSHVIPQSQRDAMERVGGQSLPNSITLLKTGTK